MGVGRRWFIRAGRFIHSSAAESRAYGRDTDSTCRVKTECGAAGGSLLSDSVLLWVEKRCEIMPRPKADRPGNWQRLTKGLLEVLR